MLGSSGLSGGGSPGFFGPLRRRGERGCRQQSKGFLCTQRRVEAMWIPGLLEKGLAKDCFPCLKVSGCLGLE